MGKLRKTVQKEVYNELDRSIFSSDDFKVIFNETYESEGMVSISFAHDSKYHFSIHSPVEFSHEYSVSRSPGFLEDNETIEYNSFQGAINSIQEWCIEIRNELKASKPVFEEVDKLRELIEEQFTSSNSDNEEFTVSEINDLHSKFNELKERVERLEKDKVITETQLKEFVSGISQVSEDIEFYPKKTWIKTSTNKLVKLVVSIAKSPEGRKVLTEGAKKLLGLN